MSPEKSPTGLNDVLSLFAETCEKIYMWSVFFSVCLIFVKCGDGQWTEAITSEVVVSVALQLIHQCSTLLLITEHVMKCYKNTLDYPMTSHLSVWVDTRWCFLLCDFDSQVPKKKTF